MSIHHPAVPPPPLKGGAHSDPVRVSHLLVLSEKEGKHVWGGAERHLRTLLPALAERNVDVELIALIWNPGRIISEGLAEMRESGVRITLLERKPDCWFRSPLSRGIDMMLRLSRLLKQRRERIIHFHLDFFSYPLAAWLARCRRIVITIHNDESYFRRPQWRLWLRLIDLRVSRYIAISERVREAYSVLSGAVAAKIDPVYYGFSLKRYQAASRQNWDLDGKGFVVGFIGRLTEQKNLPVLIRALGRIPEATGLIVGDGPQRAELERIAREEGAGNVRFAGAVEDAAALMSLFDLFCLPSKWEGLGVVLIEAMQQRVPIIGSRGGAIPEILQGGRYGLLFDADDPAALASGIRCAMTDKKKMADFADRAFRYASEEFSVDVMAEKTIASYGKVP